MALAGRWPVTLPMTTRTVRIERPVLLGDDPLDVPDTWTVIREDAPAHIGDASGSSVAPGQETTTATLFVNPDAGVQRFDRITDAATGEVYAAQWTQRYVGLGLDHVKVGLIRVKGAP